MRCTFLHSLRVRIILSVTPEFPRRTIIWVIQMRHGLGQQRSVTAILPLPERNMGHTILIMLLILAILHGLLESIIQVVITVMRPVTGEVIPQRVVPMDLMQIIIIIGELVVAGLVAHTIVHAIHLPVTCQVLSKALLITIPLIPRVPRT